VDNVHALLFKRAIAIYELMRVFDLFRHTEEEQACIFKILKQHARLLKPIFLQHAHRVRNKPFKKGPFLIADEAKLDQPPYIAHKIPISMSSKVVVPLKAFLNGVYLSLEAMENEGKQSQAYNCILQIIERKRTKVRQRR